MKINRLYYAAASIGSIADTICIKFTFGTVVDKVLKLLRSKKYTIFI